jgi:O-antigen ligase
MNAEIFRKAVAPVYLFLCLLLGGSAQGIWGNALLQIAAILIICWWALDSQRPRLSAARPLAWLLGLTVLTILFQFLPLPPGIWTHLPGRQEVMEGRALLGLSPGWSSISLAPYDTMATLPLLLPPVALFLAVGQAGGKNGAWLAIALIAGAFAGVLLGLLQVSSGNPAASPWYLYKFSNFRFATGFFANSNHMAALLLVVFPFIAALGTIAAGSTKDVRKRYSLAALTAGAIGVTVMGLALNGSLAGAGLLVPVAIATLLMIVRVGPAIRWLAAGLGIAAFLGFAALLFSPVGDRLALTGASTSISTRQEMISHSIAAAREFGPVGSGLGTFAKVYPLFEDADEIGPTYVNHAHNDSLELAVEMGVPGIILILLFLAWWVLAICRMLAAPNASLFAKAGAIGSAAILLHSLVDYPLRTSAISAVFALCLAMILFSRNSARTSKDLREARHLVIE